MAYTIWWQDIQGTQGETPHSDIDIYCLTWDGVTDPTTLRPTLDPQTHMPQNYYFVYDCAEDICDYTTYNNASYYGYYYEYRYTGDTGTLEDMVNNGRYKKVY